MLNLENGIESLTAFKRDSASMLKRLHRSGEPVVLTVNGKAEVVVQDAAAYQRLADAPNEPTFVIWSGNGWVEAPRGGR